MKVLVYPRMEGETTVLIIPGRAAHKAPTLLHGADREVVMAELLTVLEALQPEQLPLPGL